LVADEVTIDMFEKTFEVASYTNEPEAVWLSENTTPLRVHWMGSAEAFRNEKLRTNVSKSITLERIDSLLFKNLI